MATKRLQNIQGRITQRNVGDYLGELWSSRNIDISSSMGKLRLSRPTEVLMNNLELDGNIVEAICFGDRNMFILTDDDLYVSGGNFDSFLLNDDLSVGSRPHDLVQFEQYVLAVGSTTIAAIDTKNSNSINNDWWSTTVNGGALDSSYQHHMTVIRTSGQDTLSVLNGAEIKYYNPSAGHSSISWDENLIGITQTAGLNEGWVGTRNANGLGAEVIMWRVGNDQYSQAYPVYANAVLSMCTVNNIPYLVTERGEIKKFNQAGFVTVGTLPMYLTNEYLDGSVTSQLIQPNTHARPIHSKGMVAVDDKIYIYVNTTGVNNTAVNERMPSGVWEFDTVTSSLTHRYDAGELLTGVSSPLYYHNDDNGRFYFGARLENSDYVFLREDLTPDVVTRGSFVKTEMQSNSFVDIFNSENVASQMSEGDRIVVKYREQKDISLPVWATLNWTNSTTLTSTSDLSDIKAGHELEIYTGIASGYCVHVVSISETAGTYTVTVDEPVGSVGECQGFFDNWTKLETITKDTPIKRVAIGSQAHTNQVKFYLEGKNGYPIISNAVTKSINKEELK
ncbi:hypothetical protein ACMA5I_10320 [Paracoccaceae bacterium GXU_MW_L88]